MFNLNDFPTEGSNYHMYGLDNNIQSTTFESLIQPQPIQHQHQHLPHHQNDKVIFKTNFADDVFLNDTSVSGTDSLLNSTSTSATNTTTTTPSMTSYPLNDSLDLSVKLDDVVDVSNNNNTNNYDESTMLTMKAYNHHNTFPVANTANGSTINPSDYTSEQPIAAAPISPVPYLMFDAKNNSGDYFSLGQQMLHPYDNQQQQQQCTHLHNHSDEYCSIPHQAHPLPIHHHHHHHRPIQESEVEALLYHYNTDPNTPLLYDFEVSPKQSAQSKFNMLRPEMSYPDLPSMMNTRNSVVLASQSAEHSPKATRYETAGRLNSAFDVRSAMARMSFSEASNGVTRTHSSSSLNGHGTSPRSHYHSRLHQQLRRTTPPKPIKPELFAKYTEEQVSKVKLAETDTKCRAHCNATFSNYLQLIDHFEEFKLSTFEFRGFKCPVRECPMNMIGFDKKADLRHHVVIDHFKKGKVIDECLDYCQELKSIIYVCHDDLCGKGFYRRDSLTRHIKLVHNGEPNVFNQRKKLENAEKRRKKKKL
ncbi:RME1 [[Candida] subhashii]|uniref:RME1 n=1 Tax=[Candida] subhashii TaxID=561895 RepID=A0A8J5V068_9ASCO|nr:RME1 [[Candida] subhashii]KAG7665300.1 RME1 [[Candida] subhashii]